MKERKFRKAAGSDVLYEKVRTEVLKELIGLKDKLMEHLAESMSAMVECDCARMRPENVVRNEQGICRDCLGTGKLKDQGRRDWATELLLPKLIANLKPVEPPPVTDADAAQLDKKIEELETSEKDAVLQKLEAELFGSEGNGPQGNIS